MKKKSLLTSLILILALGSYTVLNTSYSNSSNLGTYNSACGCHGGANSATTVTISGLPTFYNLNTAYPITVTVSHPTQPAAGFQLQANIGTISSSDPNVLVYANTRSAGHQPKKNMTAGSATFSMTWTSPSVGGTGAMFDAVGNAVNLAGGNTGDIWNFASSSNVALPVNFSSISAQALKDHILLNFTTNNEENIESFEIEKGTDGENFETTATLDPKGNAAYEYADFNIMTEQLYYYRVKQIGTTGTFTYSTVATAKMNGAELSIYPTLITNDQINIVGLDYSKNNEINLYDLLGHKVFTTQAETTQVDLPSLSTGNYVLSIQTNGELNTVQQISIR